MPSNVLSRSSYRRRNGIQKIAKERLRLVNSEPEDMVAFGSPEFRSTPEAGFWMEGFAVDR